MHRSSCIDLYNESLGEVCLKYIVTDNYDNEEYSFSGACFNLIAIMSRCCQYNFMKNMIKGSHSSLNV